MAQVCRLCPKVGSHLVLFCIHHVNRVNSRNDSESWWLHRKDCPDYYYFIIIIIIIITAVTIGDCRLWIKRPHVRRLLPQTHLGSIQLVVINLPWTAVHQCVSHTVCTLPARLHPLHHPESQPPIPGTVKLQSNQSINQSVDQSSTVKQRFLTW